MPLSPQQIQDIAFLSGYHHIPGFYQGNMRYVEPDGSYTDKLPDYNNNREALRKAVTRINRQIEKLADAACMGNQQIVEIIRREEEGRKEEADMRAADYVRLGKTALVKHGEHYYRPNGEWQVKWYWLDGNQVSLSVGHKHLDGVILLPITKEDFIQDNGYHFEPS